MSVEHCRKACIDFNVILDKFPISDGNKCYCSVLSFGAIVGVVDHTLCNKDCPGNDEQVKLLMHYIFYKYNLAVKGYSYPIKLQY
ncbi:hypothetical protein HDU92_005508 [Lobulomyces angularis]|nr:hypothetical protein HDU92_005508 [Lobulomyces angularis]